MPPRMAIGTSHRRMPARCRLRRTSDPTRTRYIRAPAVIPPRPDLLIGSLPMAESLEERGRALENQFYEKENKEKLSALKGKMDAQRSREDLRKASGMTDDAVLDKLVELGLRANTIAALSLVPL